MILQPLYRAQMLLYNTFLDAQGYNKLGLKKAQIPFLFMFPSCHTFPLWYKKNYTSILE